MVTQSKLQRLAMLMAGTGALLFGCLAGYAKYEAHSAQAAVEIWHQNLTKANIECEQDRTSIYCESIDLANKEFDGAVTLRDERDEVATTYFALSVAIPFICALLWFGSRWGVTGSFRSGAKP